MTCPTKGSFFKKKRSKFKKPVPKKGNFFPFYYGFSRRKDMGCVLWIKNLKTFYQVSRYGNVRFDCHRVVHANANTRSKR
jgi:hypothetical protein